MALWDYQQPHTFRQCLPRCRVSAEFYENRAGERACFSSDILNVFLSFDFYMASARPGQLRYGPSLSPTPFLPTFYFCIAFLGYRLILSILSPGCQCWITHRVFHHSRPLGREASLPSFCIPYHGNTWLFLFIIVIYDRFKGCSWGWRAVYKR